MRIRPYNSATDRVVLTAMYQSQGFDYVEPNWDYEEFFSRLVLEDQDRRIVMAIMGRLTAEMYLLMDPKANTPAERLRHFLTLHQASENDMASKGIQDCFAQVPPGARMSKFKRLLALLGWVRADTWQPWTKPQLRVLPELPIIFRRLLEGDHGPQRTAAGERAESAAL